MSEREAEVVIRRLLGEDAQAFSDLRREVTAVNAVPMGLTLREELARPLEGFRTQLAAPLLNAVFGAVVAGELAATAAVSRAGQFGSSDHKMVMWGVFTSPQFRRRGFSRVVVEKALRHAFDSGARRVNLQVYLPNDAALSLYRSMGFEVYGTEIEAVCLDGTYHDGVHMTLSHDRHNMPVNSRPPAAAQLPSR